MITGMGNADDREKAQEVGIARFFTKPVEPKELVSAMEQVLGNAPPALTARPT